MIRRASKSEGSIASLSNLTLAMSAWVSFQSTAPWSSRTAASGTDTKGATMRPYRQPGRNSGGRSSTRTPLETAPFAQDTSKKGGDGMEVRPRKPEQVEAPTERLSIWLRTEDLQIKIGDNNARRSGADRAALFTGPRLVAHDSVIAQHFRDH